MRKFLLSLTMLIAGAMSVWAQVADGVYTIQADENGKRGYLAANSTAGQETRPVLTGISWDTYSGNSCTTIC